LLGAVVVIVAVGVLLIVTSGGGGTASPGTSNSAARTKSAKTQRHHRRRSAAPAVLTPASVTVAVLNGTSVTNLAHNTAAQLGTAGFREGAIATASDQTETATVVGYLPGHRAAAVLVAQQLKLGTASIQPVNQSNLAVACPASTPCTTQVVVTVGTDLASNT
jgi:hypothetical protein